MVHIFFQYCRLFSSLQMIQPHLLLDIRLAKHATTLINLIKERSVNQYFQAYCTVDLHRMATSLSMPFPALEQLISKLISSEKLSARIDSQSNTLNRREHDDRKVSVEKVLRLANTHTREIKRGILRLSLMKHRFVIDERNHTDGLGIRSYEGVVYGSDEEMEAGDDESYNERV